MTTRTKQKWTPAELNAAMRAANWKPLPAVGLWIHADTGYQVNLNALMLDKREYWHQLAERQATPPTTEPPF